MNVLPLTAPTIACLAVSLHVFAGETIAPSVPEIAQAGYRLAWADEFSGDKLDVTKWAYRTDSKRASTQRPENVALRGGILRLELKKEAANGKPYTGAGVISKPAFKYGYYEARMKIPAGSGWHTSFWMQKHDNSGGTSPGATCQEIDVCENDSAKPWVYTVNLHQWISPHIQYGLKPVKAPDLSKDFHTFGCEFTPKTIRYFLDGAWVQTIDATWLKHGDQNIWLTSIGNKDGMDESKLPAAAEVDYVRFFEKTAN
ncbi:MAG: family 16 glycosylhydrolase [Chthoniobacteraceae bacterium]